MSTTHEVALFIHLSATFVWLGGMAGIGVVNARLARVHEHTAIAPVARASEFFGAAVVGPAALLTLITGIILGEDEDLILATLWIVWGLAGAVVSSALGMTLIRRSAKQLIGAAETPPVDLDRIRALQRRLRTLGVVNLIVLFSVVWAMVSKPTI